MAAARLHHWAILLSAYSCDIVHKSFSNHNNADGLSRLPLPVSDSTSSIPSCFNPAQIQTLPVTSTSMQRATRTDPILSKVIQDTQKSWPVHVSDTLKPFSTRRNELTVEGNFQLSGTMQSHHSQAIGSNPSRRATLRSSKSFENESSGKELPVVSLFQVYIYVSQ